ncbi:MAG TPA: PA2779 family protein [Steroidobacteraceae bacterium]|nr:PA2779 family protein [Steroidobacteraceae bacterium]
MQFRNAVVYALCLAVFNMGSPLVARAELVGTLQAVESSTRAQDLAAVGAALARQEVRDQMAALGVNPVDIDTRVARLTDTELRTLAERMGEMPAGGDALAVIGIVFVVLVILELVGVIDIFKKT